LLRTQGREQLSRSSPCWGGCHSPFVVPTVRKISAGFSSVNRRFDLTAPRRCRCLPRRCQVNVCRNGQVVSSTSLGRLTTFTAGGVHVPSMIDGGVSCGQ